MADIIKNGTFEEGTVSSDNNYLPTYWQKIKSGYCGGWFTTEQNEGIYMSYSDPSSGTYTGQELIGESYPPGLYQGIDLTAYDKDLSIIITFDASADVPYVTTETETFNVYIYNAIKDSTGNYSINGNYNDYIMRESFTIDNNYAGLTGNQLPDRVWVNLSCAYSLKPGYYMIGFTPETIYDEQAVVRNTYISFDNVIADVNEISELDYQNILLDSTCDNFISSTNWVSEGIIKSSTESLEELCPENIRPYSGAIYFKSDVVVEDAEVKYYGLRQVFSNTYFCDAEIRLWHKSTVSTGDCTFKVFLYQIERNTLNDSYTIIEPAIVNETVTTHNGYWDHFNKLVEVGPHDYVLIICPPNETQGTLSELIIDNITFNIFKSYDTSNKGTYSEPFTLQNGSIVYCGNESYPLTGFRFFDGHISSNEYFIKINNKYYCTNGAIEAGTNHLLCYRNVIVTGPGDLTTSRYFDINGVMAQSTTFEYNGSYYKADSSGELTRCIAEVLSITLDKENISALVNDIITINATFDETEIPVTLNVVSSDISKVAISGITSGTEGNEITLVAKSRGDVQITISHQNENSFIVQKYVQIKVREPVDYTDDIEIIIPYEKNYVTAGDSLATQYFIIPESAIDLPIEWVSSNESIAIVDIYGVVLPKALGTCTITAKNDYGGYSDSYELTVCDYGAASSIALSSTTVDVGINESILVKGEVLTKNNYGYCPQNLIWSSNNEDIAIVNSCGYITGVTRGTTVITCMSEHDNTITNTVTVNVIGTSISVSDLELDVYEATLNPNYDSNYLKIRHRVIPENATYADIVWTSSDESKVQVSQTGDVYLAPNYTYNGYDIVTLTCKSKSRPSIKKTCTITLSTADSYPTTFTVFGDTFNVAINETLIIEYGVFSNFRYKDNMVFEASILNEDGSTTTNTITHVAKESITMNAVETGTFKIKITGSMDLTSQATCYKYLTVNVIPADEAPEFTANLNVLYALQNGTFILTCLVEDTIDKPEMLTFNISFGNGYELIHDTIMRYNFFDYQYFFCKDYGLEPGQTYNTTIKAIDSNGSETISNTVALTIPSSGEYKVALQQAKDDYDTAINDIDTILRGISSDSILSADDKAEFETRSQIFNYNYDNLRDMLNKCIDHINSQIETAQVELDTLATSLSSDGTSAASYSEGDFTTSNYQSVSDMDYYQNECIKQLVNRVLQLEARLNELTNNNN